MGLKSCVEEGDPRRCDAEEERSQRVGLGCCVCLGGWLALARQRFVLVMWQAGLVVVLVYFVLLVRRLVVESGLGGLSVEGGVGLVVVFLGGCLALCGCWQ